MDIVYMENTLKLLPPKEANELVAQGVVKETEEGVKYLVIQDDEV